MGTSGATEFLGNAAILIIAVTAGALALQSVAALLEQRRLIAGAVAGRILSIDGGAVFRNPGQVSSLAREEPRHCDRDRRRVPQEGLWQAEHDVVRRGRPGSVLRLDRQHRAED
jgi:hypothetical protein